MRSSSRKLSIGKKRSVHSNASKLLLFLSVDHLCPCSTTIQAVCLITHFAYAAHIPTLVSTHQFSQKARCNVSAFSCCFSRTTIIEPGALLFTAFDSPDSRSKVLHNTRLNGRKTPDIRLNASTSTLFQHIPLCTTQLLLLYALENKKQWSR